MKLNRSVLDKPKTVSASESCIRWGMDERNLKRLLGYGAAIATFALLSGCSSEHASFMNPKGPIALAQKAHLVKVVAITMIAVLPVLVLVPFLLWRYRYKNTNARYSPNWEYSGILDVMMWGVPFVIVFVLSIQLWLNTRALDPYKPIEAALPPLRIQVVGLDWKWLFIYPELGIASMGEMAFPAGQPVTLSLTADTVMQSFMIGSLAGQVYAMPGMRTKLNLMATTSETLKGANTQFNGDGFTSQKFDAISMTGADFNAWVARIRSHGIALNEKSYGVLGLPSTATQAHVALGTAAMPAAVVYFNLIPSEFFADVLGRYHSGRALALENQPGSAVFGNPPPLAVPNQSSKGDR